MKSIFTYLVLTILMAYWGVMGFYIGTRYEKASKYTEKHYIYKNKCLAMYKKAWLEYDCLDSTLESK
jgi:hypothetical protein